MEFFEKNSIEAIFLAEITKIEFSSVVWKKCRKQEISEQIAQVLIEKFEKDCQKFMFVPGNENLINFSRNLIAKHWQKGLRTLDSLQLASALTIKSKLEIFFSSDVLLSEIAVLEGLKIQ
jgi:predicted nucleic acid-binding protein